MNYITLFAIIIATIIVVTKLILEFMENHDREKGAAINPDEYRMGSLMKSIFKDSFNDIKESVKNLFNRIRGKSQ